MVSIENARGSNTATCTNKQISFLEDLLQAEKECLELCRNKEKKHLSNICSIEGLIEEMKERNNIAPLG